MKKLKLLNIPYSKLYIEECKYFVLNNKYKIWLLNYGLEIFIILSSYFFFVQYGFFNLLLGVFFTFLVYDILSTLFSCYFFYYRCIGEKSLNWKQKRVRRIEKKLQKEKHNISKIYKECCQCRSSLVNGNFNNCSSSCSDCNSKWVLVRPLLQDLGVDSVLYCRRDEEFSCALYLNGINYLLSEYVDLCTELKSLEESTDNSLKELEEIEKDSNVNYKLKTDKKIAKLQTSYTELSKVLSSYKVKGLKDLCKNLKNLLEILSFKPMYIFTFTENYFLYLDELVKVLNQLSYINKSKQEDYFSRVSAIISKLSTMTVDYIAKSDVQEFEDLDISIQVLYQEVMKDDSK